MKRFIWLGVLLILIGGCKEVEPTQTEIRISAASSLSSSLSQIVEKFTEEYPDITVTSNYGGSGTLRKQVEHGVPVDLVFLASEKDFELLMEKGTIEKGRVFVENRLAVIKHRGFSKETLLDYINTDGKLAIGTPEAVPAGTYAIEALKGKGLDDKLTGRIVYTKDVQQVKMIVKEGTIPFGIVYLSDTIGEDGIELVEEIDPQLHSPIVYTIGIVKQEETNTKRERAIENFYRFVTAKTAMDVFVENGFLPINQGE